MSQFMVGRQPIFDAGLDVMGYELLFRDSRARQCDAMAGALAMNGAKGGLRSVVGCKLAFLRCTRSYLVGDTPVPFPPRQTVLDIPNETPRDADLVAGCRHLVQNGYALAADGGAEGDPVLELVSVIKLDVSEVPGDELRTAVMRCSAYGVKLLAKRVEARQQLNACQRLGFDLFQGFLLSKPEIVEDHAINPSKLGCVRILERLCDPTASAQEIEDIVKTDVALSYRFLRMAGAGAARGLSRRLGSVREGVVLIGQQRLRAWVTLILLADNHKSGPDEQLTIAMTRARMAELMTGRVRPDLAEQAFTAGLVSALDLILGAPLAALVGELSLTTEVEDAVLGHTGLLGDVIADVLAWELGDNHVVRSGLDIASTAACYVESLTWATGLSAALESSH